MKNEDPFSPQIRVAFENYPRLEPSRDFSARVLAESQKRRKQSLWRRFWQVEIEGVAVWRLLGSTLSGGLFSLLILGVGWALTRPETPISSPVPKMPMKQFVGPLYAREWEFQMRELENLRPVLEPKSLEKEEFSCADFSRLLA